MFQNTSVLRFCWISYLGKELMPVISYFGCRASVWSYLCDKHRNVPLISGTSFVSIHSYHADINNLQELLVTICSASTVHSFYLMNLAAACPCCSRYSKFSSLPFWVWRHFFCLSSFFFSYSSHCSCSSSSSSSSLSSSASSSSGKIWLFRYCVLLYTVMSKQLNYRF